ncbi:hypothetical protein N7457_007740 [Penicillium paradoxum]|uniref:uncharacterized protein n=1 Tax=Penicillium paradoxum TaxID=176176 RepID=UPI0025490548|nr:uncharacterized protein N7457_007740 [Penicillium paradoxum]KAJ5772844.1 hypothetical protein N7457_007740 [Penicillium paradoxum]
MAKSSDPTPARSHALSIPEIFELILLHLDIRTLLTKATRVCRAWSHFINDSRPLQWALFFRPLDNPLNKAKIQNPLLAEAFPSVFRQSSSNRDGTPNHKHNGNSNRNSIPELTFTTFDMVRRPRKLNAYIRPEASWRRMLVQQPPVYTLALLRSSVGHGGQCLYHYTALDDQKELVDGLRMDIILEALVFSEMWDQYEYSDTEMIWGLEGLSKRVRGDLELFGVKNLDLVFYTYYGVTGMGRGGYEPSSERDVVKNVKDEYIRLGIEPKYSEKAFIKTRKSWGSLWD